MRRVELCRSAIFIIVFLVAFDFQRTEGKFVCSTDDHQQRCQWTFYGWYIYRGCVYHQKTDEPLCLMKTLDGSKGTLLTKINVTSKEFDHCFRFKYLTTGRIPVCLYFYGKSSMKINTQSHLFSNFCISNDRVELFWYSYSIVLPRNTILLNVIIETNGSISNYSLTMTDLAIEDCRKITTKTTSDRKFSTSTFLPSSNVWLKYRFWIVTLGFILLLVVLSFLVLVIRHFSQKRRKKRIDVVRRVTQSNFTPSRHFYEEPISVILPATIDISEYDHVRDNYV